MNDEAVYRTAPATPGLLITLIKLRATVVLLNLYSMLSLINNSEIYYHKCGSNKQFNVQFLILKLQDFKWS